MLEPGQKGLFGLGGSHAQVDVTRQEDWWILHDAMKVEG